MKKLLILTIIAAIFIGCKQQNNDNKNLKGLITSNTPKTIIINYDSLTIIPVDQSKLTKIPVGTPKVVPTNTNIHPVGELKTIKAGKPKIYKVVKEGFEIQNRDTIYAPKSYGTLNEIEVQHGDTIHPTKTIKAIQPKPIKALTPRYKDNATCDMQYLDVDQGMPSSYVLSIIEDSKGNLWFGTSGGGVTQYDGKSFKHYSEKEGLSNNIVRSIIEDYKGNLWFGTYGGGVSQYDGKSFKHYTEKEGLSNNKILSMIEDSKGNLWFGTSGGGVCKYNGKSFKHYTEKEGLSNNYVFSMIEDSKGNLWFGTSGGGVNKYDGESFRHYTEKEGLSNNNVLSMVEDCKGNLWFGTYGGGVSQFDGKSFIHYTEKEGLSNNMIWSMIEDNKGNLWFGTYGGGVNQFDGKSFRHYTEKEGLSNNIVRSMIEDSKENLWFGTSGGGVSQYDGKSFKHYTEKEGLSNNNVMSMIEDSKGNLWFGTSGGGVSQYDGKSFKHYTKKEGLSNNIVLSMAEDSKGNLWFGTYGGGVSQFDGKSFINYTEKEGLSNNYIMSIIEDRKGDLWFGTSDGGVNQFDGKSFKHYTEKEGLSNNIVMSIIEDKKGNLWFGTSGGGVSQFDGNSFKHYTEKEGLSNNMVWSMAEDSKGNLWFSTYGGGVSKFDGKSFKHYTEKEGLSNNIVWSMIEDYKGNLWASTENGLNFFEVSEESINILSAAKKKDNNITNSLKDTKIVNYGKQDGLIGIDFFTNSAFIDSKNRAWWGSGKALTSLDLNKFYSDTSNKAPVMEFADITLNEKFIDYNNLNDSVILNLQDFENLVGLNEVKFSNVEPFYNYPNNLELPYNINHITFNFSAIEWSAPHKIKNSFMLEGLDKDWSELTAENKADYRNIPYGKYTFKVKAIGEAGIWSEPFEYEFEIHPPWWHTWWARTFYAIIAILLIYILVKWRTAELKQRQKELVVEVRKATLEISEKNEELNQQNEEIRSQKEEIEEVHHEISQSIDYATRLQQSILPDKELLAKHLSEHFVLFKPKDKVSGDFYWWTNIENHTVITAVDCTGHGVPGAFMSLLGVSFLREIVQKEKNTNTGEILNKLRKEVIKALKQKGEAMEPKDGMDMAIISINHETNICHFSGANNPLYIITERNLKGLENLNGLDGFYEIKPNKMPIAIYEKMNNFTSHEIQLQKGDILYMFSDGYVDQFGGPKEKKFKSKPFKRLLSENRDMPMKEQKELLNNAFETWKGDLDQIDDVVVLGIKI